MPVARRILHINAAKTASRCWLPINQYSVQPKSHSIYSKLNNSRMFSSKHRCVNFNNVSDASLVSNDDVLSYQAANVSPASPSSSHPDYFEPTVASSEDITTASPVNKA
ncbi:uncharacterized protein RJT21DRAFT_37748 [Scheffersomyces amazonensis]|uniref:uncharacterized protein n=1 Tax=Scheffersomyces amazonensis TaxID=1078765 RepID=UPI00315CFE8E